MREAHFGEAQIWLLLGDFDRGWQEYEWRWHASGCGMQQAQTHATAVARGGTEIAGKTILMHADQGFGDTIQFCRYVPLLAARGARVILEVREPLRELMTGLAGATQVLAMESALPDFEIQCPLLSLPLAFKTRLETIPSAMPYLQRLSAKGDGLGRPAGAETSSSRRLDLVRSNRNGRANISIGIPQRFAAAPGRRCDIH